MRALIAAAAPGATQSLKWGMPAFSYARILVTFAAFKHHIGFFPTPAAVRAFAKDLGALQDFECDHPVSARPAASQGTHSPHRRLSRQGREGCGCEVAQLSAR